MVTRRTIYFRRRRTPERLRSSPKWPSNWLQRTASTIAIAAVVALALLYSGVFSSTAAVPQMRLEITTPPTTDPVSLAISPDGQKIVFSATVDGRARLWIRHLGSISSQPLAGTEEGSFPFWSPDSRSIGFFAQRELKRIDLDTGSVRVLAGLEGGRGGAWNRDGTIIFQPTPSSTPLFRLTADGGKPVALAVRGRFPQFLPDGRHFLFYVSSNVPGQRPGVYIGQLDSSETRQVTEADSAAVYAPPEHLLFVRQGTLLAQRFNPVGFQVVGDAFPVAEQLSVSGPLFSAPVSASLAGPIVYRPGSAGGVRQLVWFDRNGRELNHASELIPNILSPSVSPNGRRMAVHRNTAGNMDVWLIDLDRRVITRFTSEPSAEYNPIWARDGSAIVFASTRTGAGDLYRQALAGC